MFLKLINLNDDFKFIFIYLSSLLKTQISKNFAINLGLIYFENYRH